MDSWKTKTGIGSTVFILLLVIALAVVQPVYMRAEKTFLQIEKTLVALFEEKTGLSLKYNALSPSILSSVKLKGVVLSDASTGKQIAEVSRLTVSYRFLDFFSPEPLFAIKTVSINGVTLEYDALTDESVLKKLLNLRPEEKRKNAPEKKTFDLDNLTLNLPFVVHVRNIALHYSDVKNDALINIKQVAFVSHFDDSGVEIKTEGKVSYQGDILKNGAKRSLVSAYFSVEGTLFPEINGSSATVRLSPVNNADLTLFNTDLLINCADSKLQVRTMRSVLPYSFFFELDSQTHAIATYASFDKFNPFDLVRMKHIPDAAKKLKGSLLNGTLSFNSDANGISYALDGGVDFVAALTGFPFSVDAAVKGTADAVQVSNIIASGKNMQVSFTGAYDIKKQQPSGTLTLDYFVLPNGNVLSTEVYIEQAANGFSFVSPQLFLGDNFLTYLRASVIPSENSFDFVFECDDYSHADYDVAHISVSGSVLQTGSKRPYIQAQLALQNVFADSIISNAAFFVDTATAARLKAVAAGVETYAITNEVYFNTDLKDFSFNAPLFIVGNTARDGDLIRIVADGSNQTMQLTSLDVQFGKTSLSASLQADFSHGFDDFSFYGESTVNTLPYSFNGNYASGWLSVAGDYDLDAMLSLGDFVSGSVRFSALPIAFGKNILAFSTDATFSWSETNGPLVDILSFEMEDASDRLALKPKLSLAGSINSYSFVLTSLAYSDAVSVLDGSGNVLWNIDEGIFDSIHVDLQATSPLSLENLSLAMDFVNPLQKPLSLEALQNDFYVSAQIGVTDFPVGRILREQSADNTISAQVAASGTLANPFISVNVQNASLALAGSPFIVQGAFSLDDSGLNVTSMSGTWKNLQLQNLEASFDPESFSGTAHCAFVGNVLAQDFVLPLSLELQGLSPAKKWRVPQHYTVSLSAKSVSGSLFPRQIPIDVTMMRSPERIDVISEDVFSATLLHDGTITAQSAPKAMATFALNGKVGGEELNLEFTGIKVDLAELSSYIVFDWVKFSTGVATGAIRIKGISTDPEFSGALAITNPEFVIPLVSTSPFKGKRLLATIGQSVLTVPTTRFEVGRGLVDADARIEFDRWKLGLLSAHLVTPKDKFVPVNMSLPLVHYKGSVGIDLNLQLTMNELVLNGDIRGQNGEVELVTSNWQSALTADSFDVATLFNGPAITEPKPLPIDFLANLRVIVGNKVQVVYNPFLRGLIVPDSTLDFSIDSTSGLFAIKGDAALRGGEIIWLSRNFYMKEGRILFNETQDNIDPRISVRAETRERDESGNAVTIILTAQNQPVSSFTPHFSATPAKSEAEIMTLLGQVVSGDSENAREVVVASGDYLVNAVVMRRIENSLRELGNFDIFSIRTSVLQNAVKQTNQGNSRENEPTFGNFFDNSTVYIGKYFGSSVYVDTLMRWSYDEKKSNENGDVSSLVFQPDIGFELSSPFVNIRWDLAPNIEEMQKSNNMLLVPATSITLSWKISF